MFINNAIEREVRSIKESESHNAHSIRNMLARKFFKNRQHRKIEFGLGICVETWYDRKTRNWITEAKDAYGHELASTLISGDGNDAAVSHIWTLNKAINGFEAV